MDGAPVFNLVRQTLPSTRIRSLHGILNSTTNYILTQMEQGASFESALRYVQKQGIAEADPTLDIDGWDAAAKLSILIQALMGGTKSRRIFSGKASRKTPGGWCAPPCAGIAASAWLPEPIGRAAKSRQGRPGRTGDLRSAGGDSRAQQHPDPQHRHHARTGHRRNNPTVEQTAFALFADLVTLLKWPRPERKLRIADFDEGRAFFNPVSRHSVSMPQPPLTWMLVPLT